MRPHHKLVYGVPYTPEILSICPNPNEENLFYLPEYGDPKPPNNLYLIGIEYGRIYGLFDNYAPTKRKYISPTVMHTDRVISTLTYMAAGLGCLAPVLEAMFWALVQPQQPSDLVKKEFAKILPVPRVQAKSYAIHQDVSRQASP